MKVLPFLFVISFCLTGCGGDSAQDEAARKIFDIDATDNFETDQLTVHLSVTNSRLNLLENSARVTVFLFGSNLEHGLPLSLGDELSIVIDDVEYEPEQFSYSNPYHYDGSSYGYSLELSEPLASQELSVRLQRANHHSEQINLSLQPEPEILSPEAEQVVSVSGDLAVQIAPADYPAERIEVTLDNFSERCQADIYLNLEQTDASEFSLPASELAPIGDCINDAIENAGTLPLQALLAVQRVHEFSVEQSGFHQRDISMSATSGQWIQLVE